MDGVERQFVKFVAGSFRWGRCAALLLAGLLAGCSTGVKFTRLGELSPEDLEREAAAGDVYLPTLNLLAGEKLVFEVNWIGIPVGRVVVENHGFEEVAGRELHHLTMVTEANDFLAGFFHIKDTVHTWIDPVTGCPRRFEKQIQEGKYTKHQLVEYDQENHTAVYSRPDYPEDPVYEFAIAPCVQDVFSLLYWVRNRTFGLGDQFRVEVNADKKNWDVEIEVQERGLFNTEPLGQVRVFSLAPVAVHEGNPLKKGSMTAWVTADARHVPVAFQVDAPIVGSISAVLAQADLPPLPVRPPEVKPEDYDLIRIYDPGEWLRGRTETDSFLKQSVRRSLDLTSPVSGSPE